MSFKEVIGPYYSDEPKVNAESYLPLLNNYFLLMLPLLPLGTLFDQIEHLPTIVVRFELYWMYNYCIWGLEGFVNEVANPFCRAYLSLFLAVGICQG